MTSAHKLHLATCAMFSGLVALAVTLAGAVWVSQPYVVFSRPLPAATFACVSDVPLLTPDQKAFARQRGYIPVWIGGQHYILINPPEEYLL